ncbi:MAG: TRAP transporter small permease subunit [Thiolinea sp.]
MGTQQTPMQTTYKIPIVNLLNTIVEKVGGVFAWINVVLIGVILASVFMRYGMNRAMVTLEELTWYLYAVGIMFGLSYGIVKNSHIRVDIFSMHFSTRMKALVEVFGIAFLLLPFIWVILHHSVDWVWQSYSMGESSSSPQGLPHRWLIKIVLPISFLLMGLAAIARLIESVFLLFHPNFTAEAFHASGRLSLLVRLFKVKLLATNQSGQSATGGE